MNRATMHERAVRDWLDRVAAVPADTWDQPTPCADWTVRELVNHVVGEDLWTLPMLAGTTIEEVGDRFDGDLLGEDPAVVARDAGRAAVDAVAGAVPSGGSVLLSYGEESIDNYVAQLTADHLIHGWDLAVATGQERGLDAALVADVGDWYAEWETSYRGSGVVADRTGTSPDPAENLLRGFGRDPDWQPPAESLRRI